MALIYKSASNTGVYGYLPEASSTVKSLASGASGYETFDLGENWTLLDNLAISLVNFVSIGGAIVICNYADNKEALISALNAPPNTINAVVPNGQRFTLTADPAFIAFSLKVQGRYLRVKVTNGATAGSATAYIDVKGYGLTP